MSNYWVEKTKVRGRSDRETGEYALGKALWSPKQSKGNDDIYRFMREVRPGDVVLHLTDSDAFTGVSRASRGAQDFVGLPGTDWAGSPGYLVPLEGFVPLEPPLPRQAFLNTSPFRERMLTLLASGEKNLFFNSEPNLNQGGYLTPAPVKLVSILNEAYTRLAGRGLPLVTSDSTDSQLGHLFKKGKHWIFQSNPEVWDLSGAVKVLPEIVWLVSRYAEGVNMGDRIFLWEAGRKAGIVAVGTVLDGPADREIPAREAPFNRGFDERRADQPRVTVRVDQVVDPPLTRDEIKSNPKLAELSILKMAQGTNFPVSPDEAIALEEMLANRLGYTFEQLLRDTLWTEAALQELIDALRGDSHQVVLAGPPGTGKTWVAKKVVKYLTNGEASRSRIVQFHPSYSYEQFVQGLRPALDEDKAISFRPVDGIMLDLVGQMNASLGDYFLLIDEMNRANLPRVLGELMYLFEYRDERIDLPYKKDFRLPKNLRFIGTMNTADRSIRSIDVALRRRFDVFECAADPAILERYYSTRNNRVTDLIQGFTKLNEWLSRDVDTHHTIGQTYLMADEFTPDLLCARWRRKLIPLIQEYFFDQPDLASKYTINEFWPAVRCEPLT